MELHLPGMHAQALLCWGEARPILLNNATVKALGHACGDNNVRGEATVVLQMSCGA